MADLCDALHAVATSNVEALAHIPPSTRIQLYEALHYMQSDERSLDMVALALDPECLADVQARRTDIHRRVARYADPLARFLDHTRIFYPSLTPLLATPLAPLDMVDACSGRPVVGAGCVVALLVAMLAVAEDPRHTPAYTTALAIARAAYPEHDKLANLESLADLAHDHAMPDDWAMWSEEQ
jgi:hypothetical protein